MGFDAFNMLPIRNEEERSETIKLNLPFGIYDELVLADGYLFTLDEENVTMRLTVHNSARMIVVRTPLFRFSLKRGTITYVRGEFLSDTFNNNLTVDNVWAGEIIIDV